MASTSVQFSLLREEYDILLAEANRQTKEAVRIREGVIARGGADYNLQRIAPSTVATQIIRTALPSVVKRIEVDKKGRLKT